MLYKDQIGDSINLPSPPERIVSLVPSQTELLFHLDLDEAIVGRTKFCIHPSEKVKKVTVVGGTKKFRLDVIDALRPDLIIGNKEENYFEGVVKLKEKYPVWVSDIVTLKDAEKMILQIGQITNKISESNYLIEAIQRGFSKLSTQYIGKALYLIWKKPFIAVGRDTFINSMMLRSGFENVIKESRYPEIDIVNYPYEQPDFVLLSTEPYPFKEKHIAELAAYFPDAKVLLINGEMFSWYGSRLVMAADYLRTIQQQLA